MNDVSFRALPWCEPWDWAASIEAAGQTDWALFYSGLSTPYSGRYSYLAFSPLQVIESSDWEAFAPVLTQDRSALDNAWFGWLGYGLRHSLEILPQDSPWQFDAPPMRMTRYKTVLRFDHQERALAIWGEAPALAPRTAQPVPLPAVASLQSNMTRQEYLAGVQRTIARIHAGDFYQANITRKFFGRFVQPPQPLALFRRLCEISPAPYSAMLRAGKFSILSSSPERFLAMDANGQVEARPIKGSAARHADAAQDEAARHTLETSAKDRAENLMIVDLMRNDLARSCEPGSVRTERLFEVSSYATVHHMASTILGRRRADATPLEVVQGCFPPGSMTGAPKIRAMQWCSSQENIERGVYSGALGWFGGDGSCDLSVVIRTLVLDGDRFEFQVGGGIVADSDPAAEWRETLVKARGIARALGIDEAQLEAL